MNARYHFDKRPAYEGISLNNVVLHQIGDLFCKFDTVVNEHSQNCIELTCVVSGKGITRINGKEYPLIPGEINVVFPKDSHQIISDPVDPLRYYFFAFSMLENHPLMSAMYSFQRKHVHENRFFKDTLGIRGSISNALAELYTPNDYSRILLESYVTQIIVHTLQSFDASHAAYRPNLNDKKSIAFSMANYIDKNVEAIDTISDVYKNFGYSSSYLSHIFADAVGVSPSEYLHNAKMELAMRLLKQNRSVTKTAEMLGYSSIHPFCRAFKKTFGLSPSEVFDSDK